MRKWFVLSVIGGLALIPAIALADVDVEAEIQKDKRTDIRIYVDIQKDIDIEVEVELETNKAAQSETLVNQKNKNNFELDIFAISETTADVSDNSGITGANFSSGNMNNQANAVSVAVDPNNNNNGEGGLAHSQAAADQKNESNKYVNEVSESLSDLTVSGNSGITGVNQASGHMNNQANAVSVAVSLAPGVALSEADLGQVNAWNTVINIVGFSSATASVSGNSGITGVNQSSGHMNNQANVVSVAATTASASNGP